MLLFITDSLTGRKYVATASAYCSYIRKSAGGCLSGQQKWQ